MIRTKSTEAKIVQFMNCAIFKSHVGQNIPFADLNESSETSETVPASHEVATERIQHHVDAVIAGGIAYMFAKR